MTTMIQAIHQLENRFDRHAESFTFHHPYLAFFAMFIGMPIFILMVVAASAALIAFLMAWIFGWL